jgi:hypothetical protein
MKKSLLLLSIVYLLNSAIIAQVTQTHLALETKKTATWCQPCGQWGWTLQQNIEADNSSKAVIMTVYYSQTSGLYCAAAEELQNAFPYVSSTPAWYLNGINKTCYSTSGGIYSTQTRTAVKNAVDSTYSVSPLANCSYTKTLTGNLLTVNTTSKFFSDASGDYYLSVLLVENDIIAYQEGIGSTAHHMNVLRGSMSTSVFGDLIASGSIAKNSTYPKTFQKTLDVSWNATKMYLAFVIWEKTGSQYYYVNAFKDEKKLDIDDKSSGQSAFNVYPNPTTSKLIITRNEMNNKNAMISIYNVNGQLCFHQLINEDKTEIDISQFISGVYILKLYNDNKSEVIKIVKE